MSTDGDDGGLLEQVITEVEEDLSFLKTGDPMADQAMCQRIREQKYHVELPDGTELVLDTIEYIAYKKLYPKMLHNAREKAIEKIAEEAQKGQLDSRLTELATQAERKQQAEGAQAAKDAEAAVLQKLGELATATVAKKFQDAGYQVEIRK